MGLLQKLLDAIERPKELKETIDNAPNPAGPLTGSTKTTADNQADDTKDAAQTALDDDQYNSITPVLLTFSDDQRADTRAAAVENWADDAKNLNEEEDDQGAADCLHSMVLTIPKVKISIENGP